VVLSHRPAPQSNGGRPLSAPASRTRSPQLARPLATRTSHSWAAASRQRPWRQASSTR
jgi:hypothetical protein